MTKSGTGTWELGRGTWGHGTWGLRTQGRGMQGRGDLGTWGSHVPVHTFLSPMSHVHVPLLATAWYLAKARCYNTSALHIVFYHSEKSLGCLCIFHVTVANPGGVPLSSYLEKILKGRRVENFLGLQLNLWPEGPEKFWAPTL